MELPDDTPAATGAVTEPSTSPADTQETSEDQELDNIFANEASGKPQESEKPQDKPEDKNKPVKPEDSQKPEAEENPDKPDDKPDNEADKDKPDDKPKGTPPPQNGQFDAGKYIGSFVDSFPIKDISMPDGSKVNIAEVRESYPDIFNTMILMSSHISNTLLDQAIQSGELAKGHDFNEMREGIMQEKFDISLNKQYAESNPESKEKPREVLASKEFGAWSEKQPKAISELAKSKKTDDVLYILKMYNHENKQAQMLKEKKGLHKGTLRPGANIPAKPSEEEDLDAIWKEATK